MSCVRVYPVAGALAIFALAVGALFMLRVVQKTCYGPPLEKFADLQDITAALAVPRVILVSVIVLFGLFPGLLFDMIHTATMQLIGLR
jgi:NADH-quinone oxidoreductase subunit M